MDDEAPMRHYESEYGSVNIRPGRGQTEAAVRADVEASFERGRRMSEQGTEAYHSHFWWRGPFKVMVSKEVGPPAWPTPKVRVRGFVSPEPFISAQVGWRLTAYTAAFMWAPPPPAAHRRNER